MTDDLVGAATRLVRGVLQDVRFKDWRFDAEVGESGRVILQVSRTAPDTYDLSRTIALSMQFLAPARVIVDGDHLSVLRWAFEAVKEFECHEAAEFFIVHEDGEPDWRPFDPHQIDARAYDPWSPARIAFGEDAAPPADLTRPEPRPSAPPPSFGLA